MLKNTAAALSNPPLDDQLTELPRARRSAVEVVDVHRLLVSQRW